MEKKKYWCANDLIGARFIAKHGLFTNVINVL